MNVGRLMEFVKATLQLEATYNLQNKLEKLDGQLQEMINNPQAAEPQSSAIAALVGLKDASDRFADDLTPAQWDFLGEIQVQRYFGPAMAREIERKFAENQITPAVVKQFVSDVIQKRARVLKWFRDMISSMEALGLKEETLEPGKAEIGFTIPRKLFENSLKGLSEELRVIDRVVGIFSEVVTGRKEKAEVGDISTTDPLILLQLGVPVVVAIAGSVTWMLDVYERTLRIRKLRQESADEGLPENVLEEFQRNIEKKINDAIEERIVQLLPQQGKKPRDEELSVGLRWAMKALLARIERGMTVEVRFLAPPAVDEASDPVGAEKQSADFVELRQIQQDLQFPEITADKPIFQLPPPEPSREATKKPRGRRKANGPKKFPDLAKVVDETLKAKN